MQNVAQYYYRSLGARTWSSYSILLGLPPRISRLQYRPWLGVGSVVQMPVRGAKSKTTVKLGDLPQGPLEPVPETAEQDDGGPAYPTVVRQARNNMQKFDNCVLLTRVGSFYELYFEQAVEYGPLLNLKVAQKKSKAGVPSVPMLDRFLKILVQDLSKYVAISEEFANDPSGKVKSGGLMFDRRVTRILTPGTLIDEKFMDPLENNFLLAVHFPGSAIRTNHARGQLAELTSNTTDPALSSLRGGLAWLDLSTGEFFTQISSLGTLPSALARIGAKEVVVSDGLDGSIQQIISSMVEHDRRVLTHHSAEHAQLSVSAWDAMLETPMAVVDKAAFTPEEISAGSMLLTYVAHKLQGLNIKVQSPQRRQDFETMRIDKASLRGLEVLATSKEGIGGGKGSLLHTLRRTVTTSGSRLLKDWVSSPSASILVIDARLDLVSMLLQDSSLRENIVKELRRSSDCQRLVQRFSLGRGDADDLVSLFRTIETTVSIAKVLEKATIGKSLRGVDLEEQNPLQRLSCRFSLDEPRTLANRISDAIDEEALLKSHRREESESARYITAAQDVLQNEGSEADYEDMSQVVRAKAAHSNPSEQEMDDEENWIMRKAASPLLQSLHENLSELRQQREHLTVTLRNQIGAQSLSLRYIAGSGHVCHVKGAKDVRNTGKAPLDGRSGRSTKSTRTFYNGDWTNLGARMDMLKFQIRAEEHEILSDLRKQVVANLVKLRRNAAVLDELDIGCAFAILAEEQGFTRPVMNTSRNHKILGGRHPTVKIGLEAGGRAFVSNDCFVGEEERVWLITGPNMGGKSTFLRQNALISILAQTGSFVPAEHAELGIVDQVFSRVGSADDLFRDQSTFMVEMLETAIILKQASSRSFVIMDEIGRGTTPEDGIAIAFACLQHLHDHNQCRTLFATHFHILAELAEGFDHLACYCADVAERPGGSFWYVHRLRRGVNRASHALKVARLAVSGLVEAVGEHFQSEAHSRAMLLAAIVCIVFFATEGFTQQLDPIRNYCARFDHQSVLKNNTLYIDGGKQSFIDVDAEGNQTGNITVGINRYLIAVDLSKPWDWKTNVSMKALLKPGKPEIDVTPPVTYRGALFFGSNADPNIYLWGGTTSKANTSFPGFIGPLPITFTMWSFNIVSQVWNHYDMTHDIQYRPSSGAFAEARDQHRSFWLNGQVDAGSQTQTTRLDSSTKIFQEGLIIIDHSNQTAKNVSTKSLVGNKPRTRGRMQYLSTIGANGIIVLIGGNQKVVTDTTDRSLGDLVREQSGTYCSQGLIDVADADGSSARFRCFLDF
ncbi:MAG: hypothetical protein Q9182_003948 [Xanthomendoza sp. 2 TL-2023]